MTPARFARGYLAFLEDPHARGAERIVDPARLDAYQRVLGWLGSQEEMTDERFMRILASRAQASPEPEVRWVCADVLGMWKLPGPRAAYAGRWADGEGLDKAQGLPWAPNG